MIEYLNFKYNKEYKELIEAFIPNLKDKGLILVLELEEYLLKITIGDYKDSVNINKNLKEKTSIKQGIYKLLSKYKKRDLKWGILVGVNPLKLFKSLEEKWGTLKAREVLKDIYYIEKEKIELGFEILNLQKPIKDKLKKKSSIYINIPFCPSKCKYCSYPTYLTDESLMDEYIDLLILEIKSFFKNFNSEITSIYIGGGTPSSVGVERLEKLLHEIKPIIEKSEEFTIELGRPDTISEQLLNMIKKYRVDRISINPQSMKDKTLRSIGRNHTKDDIIDKILLARKLGFKNINMDLIIGLPGEEKEDFISTLEYIKKLKPESLSVHSLALKKGSKLTEEKYRGKAEEDFQRIRDDFVEKNFYIPYYLYRQKHMYLNIENIGYSKNGFESLYNIAMMEDIQNIYGFGLGSSTKIVNDNIKRQMNPRTLKDYKDNIEKTVLDKLDLYRSTLWN